MFQKLKIKIVNYFIERELSRTGREKVATNISRARTVGILFSLENEPYYDLIINLIEELTLKKKVVNALVFSDRKQIPPYFIPKLKIDIFTPRNLNWLGIPDSGFIKEFTSRKFDILLDLTISDHLPLDYIAAVSQAGFKVGRHRNSMIKHFDVLINKNEEVVDATYLRYIMDYSAKINTTI